MTWQQLLKAGRVEAVRTGKIELDEMRAIVAHCLQDSALPLFPDNQFALIYNAARTLAAMATAAAGYRIKQRGGGHYNTFVALKAALGSGIFEMAEYLNNCREKRNELSYEAANVVTTTEVQELLRKTRELEIIVEAWIAENHPHLKP